jgi:hypothetical protein
MENWNKNEWQGKRKGQIETSYKAVGYSLVLMVIVGMLITIIK